MFTLTPSAIKEADFIAINKYGLSELTLMQRAAKSCVEAIVPLINRKANIVILCGKGNNGGDGYEIARLLADDWYDITVINVFDTEPSTETAKAVYELCKKSRAKMFGFKAAREHIEKANVIIDAIFGVGFKGSIEKNSPLESLITFSNTACALRIAIDVPSGINAYDGSVSGVAFNADYCFTMAYIKTGMLSYPAKSFCRKIEIMDIGYPEKIQDDIEIDALIPDKKYLNSVIPKRKPASHKGNYGRLLMYCGSSFMTGACVLAANAALRSGVGLIEIARDEATISKLQTMLTEPVFTPLPSDSYDICLDTLISHSKKASAILTGCGLGQNDFDKEVLLGLIQNAECPIIIDADGINALCPNKHILKEAKATPIITPHPLEFARLSGLDINVIQKDRINSAKNFAKEYGCIVVLKGAGTVIASPDGKLALNTTGNPGLAKGGSGDVLAGITASFAAQGIPLFESAVAAVYLHGLAADILKEQISEYGFLPQDLPMAVARLLP